jgi:chitinase
VAKGGNGLFAKPVGPLPRGTWEPAVYDYKDLARNYIPKMKRYWHAEAKVPWLHDPTTGLMISYDDAESLRHKAAFARKEKLGGVMIWEITADDADSTLLKAIHQGLNPRP